MLEDLDLNRVLVHILSTLPGKKWQRRKMYQSSALSNVHWMNSWRRKWMCSAGKRIHYLLALLWTPWIPVSLAAASPSGFTQQPSEITRTSAVLYGILSPNGLATSLWF